MGMVPYELHAHFGDRVYFVDRRGLTDGHLTQLDAIPRASWGLVLEYDEIIDGPSQSGSLERRRQVQQARDYIWGKEPMIVYGLWFESEAFAKMVRAFEGRGFRLVQNGVYQAYSCDPVPKWEHLFIVSRDAASDR